MISPQHVTPVSIIYGVGVLVSAVAVAAYHRRRFGSDGLFDDVTEGVFGALGGLIWPILALGLVISLAARAVIALARSAR